MVGGGGERGGDMKFICICRWGDKFYKYFIEGRRLIIHIPQQREK